MARKRQSPNHFQDFTAQPPAPKFDSILETCVAYLSGEITQERLFAMLRKPVSAVFSKRTRDSLKEEPDRKANLRALQSLIGFLVAISRSHKELNLVHDIGESIVAIIQEDFGRPASGFGMEINFSILSELKAAIWTSRAPGVFRPPITVNKTLKIIRINDIPFAESVYPVLLSRKANDLGHSIIVEDVEWTDIATALYTKKIDVALCNGPLKKQLANVLTMAGHRLSDIKNVFRSEPLMRYQHYPIIRRSKCQGTAQGKIGIPSNSDFEDVANQPQYLRNGILVVPLKKNGDVIEFPNNKIVHMQSADDVLAHVVDGQLEYGLVGGLQARYATTQFAQRVAAKSSPKSDNHFCVEQISSLTDETKDEGCRFWVMGKSRTEAAKLISIMVTLWNAQVGAGWKLACSDTDPDFQAELVEIVNCHRHRAFIKNFQMLKDLIDFHDDIFSDIPTSCVQVPFS